MNRAKRHRNNGRDQVSGRILGAILGLALVAGLVGTTPVAADDDDNFVAVKAGKILTVSGEEIEDGVIVIRNGKVEAVGKKVEIPYGAKVIDAKAHTVMPGLVNVASRLGLGSYRRSGTRTNLTVASELYPTDDTFKQHLEAGFTTVGLFPLGNGFPGQASAVRPIPGTREDVVLEEAAYVRIPFGRPSSEKRGVRNALKQAQAEIDKIEKARKAWEEKQQKAKAEAEAKKKAEEAKKAPAPEEKKPQPKGAQEPPKQDPKKGDQAAEKKEPEAFKPPAIKPTLQPLVDLIRKEDSARSLVEIARAEGFVHFEDLMKKYDIAHTYLVRNARRASFGDFSSINDTDLGHVTKQMGEKKAMVVLYPEINKVPYTADLISLPHDLLNAGCTIAFLPSADTEQGLERFREKVAEIVKQGFPRKAALEAMTVNAAKVLGLSERLGTIEAERDANLIFLDGDPLDPFTEVKRVMIEGEIVAEYDSKS